MTRTPLTLIAVATLLTAGANTAPASAQETPRERAMSVLPSDLYESVAALAAASGVPDEPIFNKALEGVAKRVPTPLLLPAIEAYAGRLGVARDALGPAAATPLLVAGADALQRGVPSDALRALEADGARSPVALLVLADLHETGVPTDRALAVLREAIAQRTQDDRMLDIPADVRRLIRDGRPPTDAADRVRQTLRDRRGGGVGPPVPPGSQPTTDRVRRPGGGV